MRTQGLTLILTMFLLCNCKKPEGPKPPAPGPLTGTVIFLGDNLTHYGRFISHLDAVFAEKKLANIPELINLGLPLETCTGFSEPDRLFPRPNIHDRLDRALELTNANMVFVCYGTNDGIFSPFSEERFAAYKTGINSIIEKVQARGSKIILMTPPPFDPENLRPVNGLRSADSPKYTNREVYELYDTEVLAKYSDWILQQQSRVDFVVDLRTPLLSYLQQKRISSPQYTFRNGGFGIDNDGHTVVAKAILSALGESSALVDKQKWQDFTRSIKQQQILHPAWLTHVGNTLPDREPGLPLDEARKVAAKVVVEFKNNSPEKIQEIPK